jgi:membrane-associated phospholipid phosphatase
MDRLNLRAVDALTIFFLLVLSLIIAAGSRTADGIATLLLLNAAAIGTIVLLSVGAGKGGVTRFLHDWYPVPAIFLIFKEIHETNVLLGIADQDALLIGIDRAIFGTDPTVWIGRFASPPLTELFEIAYASYYFILLAVGVELFIRKDRGRFAYALFVIVYGFFLSYLGYLFVPAVGPRFTLHDFSAIAKELPGLYLTEPIRAFLNAGESIPREDMSNAIRFVQRDAFPSGHTELTLIALYLATQFRLRSRYVLYFFGSLLIVSTVYLRYHYVIDLIGGALFMLGAIWTAPKLFAWWEKIVPPIFGGTSQLQ